MSLRGTLEHFPLETVVQLLASTGKTGQLEVRPEKQDGQGGSLGFAEGRLVSASSGSDAGEDALGSVFSAERGEFEFIPWREAPGENLKGDLSSLLDRALKERDRMLAVREVVPSDSVRFRLSDRAAQKGNITLNSTQWRALLAVNGQRDVHGIADALGSGRMPTLGLLADLVRAGMIDAVETPARPAASADPDDAASRVPQDPAPDTSTAPHAADDSQSAPPAVAQASRADDGWSHVAAQTPAAERPADVGPAPDERLAAVTGAVGAPETAPPPAAWQPPAHAEAAPPAEPEKKKGLFGFLKREDLAAPSSAQATGGGRNGQLASFANTLLTEFSNGQYGKPGIDDRIANLLMRVDEQADPIDRPLPIVDDRIDVATLEREAPPEQQLAPYLAVLVKQIYEDAEGAFGRDKARRGYRAAQQRVFGSDTSTLSAPDLASHLPKA